MYCLVLRANSGTLRLYFSNILPLTQINFIDKENYKPEEVLVMNVKNLGNQSLIFSDSKSDVIINNLNGNQTYEPSTLGTLALEPNEIKTYT